MAQLAPLLPDRYAPLQKSGGGLQGFYLTMLSDDFATSLADLIGREARTTIQMRQVKDLADTSDAVGLIESDHNEMEQVIDDKTLHETRPHDDLLKRRRPGLIQKLALERACYRDSMFNYTSN